MDINWVFVSKLMPLQIVQVPQAYTYALLLTAAINLFVGILIIAQIRKHKPRNLFLAIYFLFTAYPPLLAVTIISGAIEYVPHTYRTGFFALLLCMPTSYIYMRSELREIKVSEKDLVHLIPVLVYGADYFPFFLESGSVKLQSLSNGYIHTTIMRFGDSRFFPPDFYLIVKFGVHLFYWILQAHLLLKTKAINLPLKSGRYPRLRKWLIILLFCQLSFLMPPAMLFHPSYWAIEFLIYFLMLGGLCIAATAALFFFPELVYSSYQTTPNGTFQSINTTLHHNEIVRKMLTDDRSSSISEQIESFFNEKHPYLKPQYALAELSADLALPAQYLSEVINHRHGKNFNDFINQYRVEHCLQLMQQKEHEKITLAYLAKNCGFNNRNTFTTAFKKVTGQTPSEYIKSMQFDTRDTAE